MLTLSTTVGNATLNALVAAADAGSGAAKIKFYSGGAPITANATLSGNTLLATLECSDPCGVVASMVLTFNAITNANAVATGTATFFRLTDSDNNVVAQGAVSDSAGNGEIKLSTVALVTNAVVSVTSATISVS